MSLLPANLSQGLCEAVDCFNTQQFFECHEVLETLWHSLHLTDETRCANPLEKRQFIQGFLQVAVGFYHLGRRNRVGAKNKLQAGLEKLNPFILADPQKEPRLLAESGMSLLFVEQCQAILLQLLQDAPAEWETAFSATRPQLFPNL